MSIQINFSRKRKFSEKLLWFYTAFQSQITLETLFYFSGMFWLLLCRQAKTFAYCGIAMHFDREPPYTRGQQEWGQAWRAWRWVSQPQHCWHLGQIILGFPKCRLFWSVPDLSLREAIATPKLWQPRVPWGSKPPHLTYMTSYKAVMMICYLRTGWCVHYKLFQSRLTLCDPMDYTPPGSSVHGILQARTPEWVATPCSRGSSWPKDRTCISCNSCIAGGFFTAKPPRKP